MFQSYTLKKFLDAEYDQYFFEYEITDDEFGAVSGVGISCVEAVISFRNETAIAVIQEYSKRNLNVAANLMRAFIWMHKLYPYWSIQNIININKKNTPLFQQYEDDLQKYLLLL
jgi:hypothetical protein